ncbi:hypothetical protein IAQ61_010264, partial [Plenodomus lingam]|uniref:Predicted protein n=1 Tax=Leptosphaeria maculans (strain JN3 / isolate v23.1.3 / race Av1-4-5-6-7-8) TaxID=985895 RepID=E5A3F2_LEPMJ
MRPAADQLAWYLNRYESRLSERRVGKTEITAARQSTTRILNISAEFFFFSSEECVHGMVDLPSLRKTRHENSCIYMSFIFAVAMDNRRQARN